MCMKKRHWSEAIVTGQGKAWILGLGVMVHACNPSYWGGRCKRIMVPYLYFFLYHLSHDPSPFTFIFFF
jgi:hypothetical protein